MKGQFCLIIQYDVFVGERGLGSSEILVYHQRVSVMYKWCSVDPRHKVSEE